MTDCSFCNEFAENEKGAIIYVRANIKFDNLAHWKTVPICQNCWDQNDRM